MVRETRHLWVGNLPEPISEERIREHFKRYGPVQSVKVVSNGEGVCATVAFVDICSAAKAHKADHRLEERLLKTTYYEPSLTAISASHYPPGGPHHRGEASHYNPASSPVLAPLGARSPRFSSSLSEEHNSYERSSHFYENRRDETIGYNGPGGPGPPGAPGGPAGLRRAYPADRDVDFGGRGRIRSYPPRNHIFTNGRAEPGEYRWGGGQYRYHTDSYVEEKIRRPGPETSPPPIPRMSSRNSRVALSGKRRPPTSRSGSESPSSSRSSRSSSSSSSSSTTSRSSSSQSGSLGHSSRSNSRSPRRISGISSTIPAIVPSIASPSEKRPFAISVKELPPWSSDNSLKDGLFHDYKKHGIVTDVRIFGSGADRYAVVYFLKPEDAEKALDASQNKQFFGVKIQVTSHDGSELEEKEVRTFETELDEYHPKATRTLFIGGLDKNVTVTELRKQFEQFGEIIEIDIKKQSGVAPVSRQQNSSTYAFCQYSDIRSVVQAVKRMDGELLCGNRIKLGFGKSMPNRFIWVGGISESLTDVVLWEHFLRFGSITYRIIDREKGHALIAFENETHASDAVTEMRGFVLNGRRLQIDFASKECQVAFYESFNSKQEFTATPDRSWERREPEKFERPRREGSTFAPRPVQTQRIQSYPARARRAYEGFEDYPAGRNYEEFADDSFERDLHEYAGRQRFENGPNTPHSTANATPNSARRKSFSPVRAREEEPSPHSPRPILGEQDSLSPMIHNYEDVEGRKSVRNRSTSDQESYHSHSPPPNKLSSPRVSKTSSRRPSRSPSTPVPMSPSREVTVLEDRGLPDPRRRRPSDFKDLVVRISDVKRTADSPVRLRNSKIHSEHEADDAVNASCIGRVDSLDPRLSLRREEPISSGDERNMDSERPNKKSKFNDGLSYEKSFKRVSEHQEPPSFRKPFETRKLVDSKGKKDNNRNCEDPLRSSPQTDPRYRKSSLSGSSDIDESQWRNREVHYGVVPCETEFLSDASPPGTPVRDEREEPSIDVICNRKYISSHVSHFYQQREKSHPSPLSLPLPKFAQQARAHLSPRGTSSSPRGGSLLRSPSFTAIPNSHHANNSINGAGNNHNNNNNSNNNNNNNMSWTSSAELNISVDDSLPILADTPVSPGPAIHENISDSESSTLLSPTNCCVDLEERIKALDEKYEKWTGATRSVGIMHNLRPENEGRGRGSHNSKKHIPDIQDLRSQCPSDIVKSLLAKRSVFDEDSERLENISDKYEPRPYSTVGRSRYSSSMLTVSITTANTVPEPNEKSTSFSSTTCTTIPIPSATPLHSLPGIRHSPRPVNYTLSSNSQVSKHTPSGLLTSRNLRLSSSSSSSPITSPTIHLPPAKNSAPPPAHVPAPAPAPAPKPTLAPDPAEIPSSNNLKTCISTQSSSISSSSILVNSKHSSSAPLVSNSDPCLNIKKEIIEHPEPVSVAPDVKVIRMASSTGAAAVTPTQLLLKPLALTTPIVGMSAKSKVKLLDENQRVNMKDQSILSPNVKVDFSQNLTLPEVSDIAMKQEPATNIIIDPPIKIDYDVISNSKMEDGSFIPNSECLKKRKHSTCNVESLDAPKPTPDLSNVKTEIIKVEPECKKAKLDTESHSSSREQSHHKEEHKIEKEKIKTEEKENVPHNIVTPELKYKKAMDDKTDAKIEKIGDVKLHDKRREKVETEELVHSIDKSIHHSTVEKKSEDKREPKFDKEERSEDKKEAKKRDKMERDGKIPRDSEQRKTSDDVKNKLDKRERSKDRKDRSKVKEKGRHRNSVSHPESLLIRDKSKDKDQKKPPSYSIDGSKSKDRQRYSKDCKSSDKSKHHSRHFDKSDAKESTQHLENDILSSYDQSKRSHPKVSKPSCANDSNLPDDHFSTLQKSRFSSGRSRESTETNDSECFLHDKARDHHKKHESSRHEKNDELKHRHRKSSLNKMKPVKHQELIKQDSDPSSDEESMKGKSQLHPAKRTKQRSGSNCSSSRRARIGKKSFLDTESDTIDTESDSDHEEQPKKSSYFDVTIYDGNMYDKVKARRVRSIQNQDEQKQQECKLRMFQRSKKAKKLHRMHSNGAISESEDSCNEILKKRGNACIHSSSEEETCSRIRPNHLSSEESDSMAILPNMDKSKITSVLKDLTTSKNFNVSDITTDDDTIGCSTSVHNLSRSDSDSEPHHTIRKNKTEFDSDVSETGVPKPPRPGLSAGHTKLKSKSEASRNKLHSGKESIREETFSISEEDEKLHETTKLDSSSELCRHPSDTKDKIRKDGTRRHAFGLMSDDSDSNIASSIPFHSSDLITTTSYRKDSVSSLVSEPLNVSPVSSSRTPARPYESDMEEEFRPRTPAFLQTSSKLSNSYPESVDTKEPFSVHEMKNVHSPICKGEVADDAADWRETTKDTVSETSRAASDSGKGSSSGVSTTSSGSCTEELLLLDTGANAALYKEDIIKSSKKSKESNKAPVRKDKKKKKKHKDKRSNEIKLLNNKDWQDVAGLSSLHCNKVLVEGKPPKFDEMNVRNVESVTKRKDEPPPSGDGKSVCCVLDGSSEKLRLKSPPLNMPLIESPKEISPISTLVKEVKAKDSISVYQESAIQIIADEKGDLGDTSEPAFEENRLEVSTPSNKPSRSKISQEETLNAVAGLLACFNDYTEENPQADEETILQSEASTNIEDPVYQPEEAQKAAQILQSEMPEAERDERDERTEQWNNNLPSLNEEPREVPPLSEPASTTVVSSLSQQVAVVERVDASKTQSSVEDIAPFPDSPSSVLSEPALQIDEDQPTEISDSPCVEKAELLKEDSDSTNKAPPKHEISASESGISADMANNSSILNSSLEDNDLSVTSSVKEQSSNDSRLLDLDNELNVSCKSLDKSSEGQPSLNRKELDTSAESTGTADSFESNTEEKNVSSFSKVEEDSSSNIVATAPPSEIYEEEATLSAEESKDQLDMKPEDGFKTDKENTTAFQFGAKICAVEEKPSQVSNLKEEISEIKADTIQDDLVDDSMSSKNDSSLEPEAQDDDNAALTDASCSAITEEDSKLIKSGTLRGRARGRGRRGNRRGVDTTVMVGGGTDNVRKISTRSSINTRSTRSRGRGRPGKNSESDISLDGVETPPVEAIRRSTRPKRATKHPDMVEHEETTNRRKRGSRGGKTSADELAMRSANSSSDVYDFHGSDEDTPGSSVKKGKKESKASPGRSPIKSSDEASDQAADLLLKRKSPRIKDKSIEREVPNITCDLESVFPPHPAVQQLHHVPPVTRSRGKGRVKEDEEVSPLKKLPPRARVKQLYEDSEISSRTQANETELPTKQNVDQGTSPPVTYSSLSIHPLPTKAMIPCPVSTAVAKVVNTASPNEVKPSLIVTSIYPKTNTIPVKLAIVSSSVQNLPKVSCENRVSLPAGVHKSDQTVTSPMLVCSTASKDSSSRPALLSANPNKDLPTSPITPVISVHNNSFLSAIPLDKRDKSDSSTPLVDPVTGHLTNMTISDDGLYIPVSGDQFSSFVANRVNFDGRMQHPSALQGKVLQVLPTGITVTGVPPPHSHTVTKAHATTSVSTPVVSITRSVVNPLNKGVAVASLPRGGEVSVELVPRSRPPGVPFSAANVHANLLTKVHPDTPVIQQVTVSSHSSTNPMIVGSGNATQPPKGVTAGVSRMAIGVPIQVKDASSAKTQTGSVAKVINAIQSTPVSSTGQVTALKGGITTAAHAMHRPTAPAGTEFVVLTPQTPPHATPTGRSLGPPNNSKVSVGGQVEIRPSDLKDKVEEVVGGRGFIEGPPHRQDYVSVSGPRYSDARYREAPVVEVSRLPRTSPTTLSPSGRHPDTDNVHLQPRQSFEVHVGPNSAPTRQGPRAVIATLPSVPPKAANVGHYYTGRDFNDSQKNVTTPPHSHQTVALDPYLTSPPLVTPPSSTQTPPPAHQTNVQQRENHPPVNQLIYPRAFIVPEHHSPYGDKLSTHSSLPMDLKLANDKAVEEKDQRAAAAAAAATATATSSANVVIQDYMMKQSSPHHIPAHYDRTTDSPKVTMVYSRRYPAYDGGLYPNRAGTPGGIDPESLPRSPVPSHPYGAAASSGETTCHQTRTPLASPGFPAPGDGIPHLAQSFPIMWDGLLGLKNFQALVKMHFISGNVEVARSALRGDTPIIKINQRMRLGQSQLEGVARKMQVEEEHCVLMALPCGRNAYDLIQQQFNLDNGFIKYLGEKLAAGIVNVFLPGSQQSAYVIHIFPPCDFANENLHRIAPQLLQGVANTSRLLVVIAMC